MAEVIPFRGILYNTSTISGKDVVAPPYDIITPEYKKQLYEKSPHNIVRIDFGKEFETDNESNNKYTRALEYFNSWLKDGILTRGKNPCFYAHEISYEIKGRHETLRGFLGLVRLEELGKGTIYPHECTHSTPKVDRLNLMRSCNANISPIFSLYNSPDKKASDAIGNVVQKSKPHMEAEDINGALHRLWVIEDKKNIETIKNDLKDKAIFIADGHHRYETALEFQREMKKINPGSRGDEPFNYVLMFFANISEGGITILPAHRLVKNIPDNPLDLLSGYFDAEPLASSEDIEENISRHKHAIGFYRRNNGRPAILKYKGSGLDDVHPALKGLDVTILHELIFKRLLKVADIGYEMDAGETIGKVNKGLYDAAFFLNSTKVEDVERVALSSVRMPLKSTYFYPKLLTGFVINSFR